MNEIESGELNIMSAEWAFKQTNKLFKKYKKCHEENRKREIKNQINSLRKKMDYESEKLREYIEKDERGF